MRSWPGLAALGAGLIHLGISAGSPPLLLLVLLVPGVAEVAWGVLALARPDAARPRTALVVAAALVAAQVLVLLATSHGGGAHAAGHAAGHATGLPLGAVTGATVLDLAAAATTAVGLRRGSGPTPGPVAFLLGTGAGAAVVAALVVTSLAGTAVGAGHGH